VTGGDCALGAGCSCDVNTVFVTVPALDACCDPALGDGPETCGDGTGGGETALAGAGGATGTDPAGVGTDEVGAGAGAASDTGCL